MTEARRREANEAPSPAKVIRLDDVREAAEPDERTARGPSARRARPAAELDPDVAE